MTETSSQPQPERAKPERFYRPELDGLRFFAFFFVYIHHCIPHKTQWWLAKGFPPAAASVIGAISRSGGLGVDLFFALSAYLITELLLREKEAIGSLDAKAFLVRRALRIWPLFFLFLGAAAVLDRTVFATKGMPAEELVAFVFFLGNWSSAIRGFSESVAAPLWSVSIEEQFYLLWPFVVRRLTPRQISFVAGGMIVAANIARVVLSNTDLPHPLIWCSTVGRLDSIGFGVLLAIGIRQGWISEFRSLAARMLTLMGCVSAWVVLEMAFPIESQSLGRIMLGYPVVAITAALMVWASIGDRGGLVFLRKSAMVYLGRISYGLYVYHVFAIKLGALVIARSLPAGVGVVYIIPAFIFCVALSAASYRWVEGPFLKLKRRFTVIESREQ